MGKTKPPYAAAYKQQMVELVQAGRTPAELSREFGVSAQSISTWVTRAAADAGRALPGKEVLTTAEREELARLRRENRRPPAGDRLGKQPTRDAPPSLAQKHSRPTLPHSAAAGAASLLAAHDPVSKPGPGQAADPSVAAPRVTPVRKVN